MVACKAKVSVKAVAASSALITDTTVRARGTLLVNAFGGVSLLAFNRALDIAPFCVGNSEERLTARVTRCLIEELHQFLLSGVVTVSEKDVNNWCGSVCCNVDINFNLRDGKVGESFK